MKVLFLDIDGVLNRDGTKERCGGFIGVDHELSERLLNWIVKQPEVKIVLSSSWRIYTPYAPCEEHLNEAGIFWIDKTPRIPGERGYEIQDWLNRHPEVTHYAILDDNSDMLPEQMKHFVQTSEATGLQKEHLGKLEEIFNGTSDRPVQQE